VLTTSVERLEGTKVKLTVTVPAELVDESIARTYKAVAKQVRIPGFRPGKAPRPMIDTMVGHDYVMTEATEDVVNTSYPVALDVEALRPIVSPEMEGLENVEPGQPYTYTADIEVRPDLTLSSAKDFSVALPAKEATQAEIDAQLTVARERFASLEPVEDRGIEVDDFVLLSFVGTVDGESYEGNEVDKYLYEMSRGLMPTEFDTGIIGAKPGEERDIEFVIPETSSNADFVGKKAGFHVTIHEIKAKKLPEIDEEFAANLGGFDSVEEMITDLKNRLDLQKATDHDREKERRVRELVASRLVGDVPDAMIESRQSTMMRDFLSMLETREIPVEEYLTATGIDMDTLEADIRVQGEQSVREDLALEALCRELGMAVSAEDLDAELNEIADATGTSVEDARKRWEELGLMAVVTEQIMHRKAVKWLLDNAEVTVEETSAADDSAEDKKSAKKKPAAEKTAKKTADDVAASEE
jgi:trigger factor